ncbi:Vacuolar protein sorting-associated protein 16, partial [Globisporangium splendens]
MTKNSCLFMHTIRKQGGNGQRVEHFPERRAAFNKSTYLSYAGACAGESSHLHDGGYSSKLAFYQAMKQAVSRMQFAKESASKTANRDGDMEEGDQTHINFMLTHWPREMDAVYDHNEDFPFTVPIHSELTMNQITESESLVLESFLTQVTTHEEASRSWERGYKGVVGSSLIETLSKLFALYSTRATALIRSVDLAEEFEVHPRLFSWTLLKVLAQTEQWQALLIITAAARPAIGSIPVVELLLDEDHADLAQDLLALIDAPEERLEIMVLIAKHHTSGGGSSDRETTTPVTP